jgi:hypothetical protein
MNRIADFYWEASDAELWQMYRGGVADAAIVLIFRATGPDERDVKAWTIRLAERPEQTDEGI